MKLLATKWITCKCQVLLAVYHDNTFSRISHMCESYMCCAHSPSYLVVVVLPLQYTYYFKHILSSHCFVLVTTLVILILKLKRAILIPIYNVYFLTFFQIYIYSKLRVYFYTFTILNLFCSLFFPCNLTRSIPPHL